jgi:hypothetical protein
MKKIILFIALFFHAFLVAGTPIIHKFKGPTEQLIKRETWGVIEHNLTQMSIPKKHFPYFNKISNEENWGHIGYHGANQGFRVYQDIIRLIVEEILSIPIPENYHFLRMPGDPDLNLNSIEEFKEFWGALDNRDTTRAKQLLSLNYGIYSNYDNRGSCSLNLFVKDKDRDINFHDQLVPLFERLGIPLNAIDELLDIASRQLDGDGGILLQLIDNSHVVDRKREAYNFADEQCYPSKRGGFRYDPAHLSDHIERIMSDLYVKHKLDASPQLRLLINNRYTLNPFSHLEIKRWDFYDAKTIADYEHEMRESIKNLPYDSTKAMEYRKLLLEIWDL